MNHEKLLPCPFCGGEAEAVTLAYKYVRCDNCHFCIARSTIDEAISAWNRRTPPAAVPEPWGWLCNGKGDGWEERDKVVRDPELIARYRERPDLWRIEPLYLGSPPAAVPDGWVMVPREPTSEMTAAATNAVVLGCDEDGNPVFIEVNEARNCYGAMISAAPAAPTEASDE